MRSVVLAACVFVAQTVFAAPAEDIAAQFVDVLRQDSLAQLAMLVDEGQRQVLAFVIVHDAPIRAVRLDIAPKNAGARRT